MWLESSIAFSLQLYIFKVIRRKLSHTKLRYGSIISVCWWLMIIFHIFAEKNRSLCCCQQITRFWNWSLTKLLIIACLLSYFITISIKSSMLIRYHINPLNKCIIVSCAHILLDGNIFMYYDIYIIHFDVWKMNLINKKVFMKGL